VVYIRFSGRVSCCIYVSPVVYSVYAFLRLFIVLYIRFSRRLSWCIYVSPVVYRVYAFLRSFIVLYIRFSGRISCCIYVSPVAYRVYAFLRPFIVLYEGLPKIPENLNIPRKPLELRTCAARWTFLYLSTNGLAIGIFISARVSEFWLCSLHHFHECLRISKLWELRSKELNLIFASSSTKLQLRSTEC